MAAEKFNDTDRAAVVKAIEEHLGIKLGRVGRRTKWLHDENGRSYWVIGGVGMWHGIPAEMMDAEVCTPTSGMLVVAVRKKSTLDVYIGPLGDLVKVRTKLSTNNVGDYQFTLVRRGNHLYVEQAPNVALRNLLDVDFDDSSRRELSDRIDTRARISKLLGQLSNAERKELLKSLEQGEP